MMNLLNTYLQLGVQATAERATWPLLIAAGLIALTILRRRRRD